MDSTRDSHKSQDAWKQKHAIQRLREGIFSLIPLHYTTNGICSCPLGAQCGRPGKHPIWKNYPARAIRDQATVERVWSQAPFNIGGIVPEGFGVLDCDWKNDGPRTLGRLEQRYGDLPASPTTHTAGGGFHKLFRTTSPALASKQHFDIGLGLEWLSAGHVVVLPGSVGANGIAYEYSKRLTLDRVPIADLPGWLEQEALAPHESKIVQVQVQVQAPHVRQHAKFVPTQDDARVMPERVPYQATGGPFRLPETIPYGQRHTVLLAYAGRLRFEGSSDDAISRQLFKVNRERCQPPLQTFAEIVELQEIIEHVVEKPKGHGRPVEVWDEAQEFLPRFAAAIHQADWPGLAGRSQQAVALALLGMAQRAGTVEVGASERELAELAGLTRKTVHKSTKILHRLGWIGLIPRSNPTQPKIYQLRLPTSCPPAFSALLPPRMNGVNFATFASDVFRPRGLGKSAGLVYGCLREESASRLELEERAGLGTRTLRYALMRLARVGLATKHDKQWTKGPAALDDVAQQLGVQGIGERQKKQHQHERECFHAALTPDRPAKRSGGQ